MGDPLMRHRRKLRPINQNPDKRRLRGLDLGAVLLVKRKPLSRKESATLEWPHQIDQAVAQAKAYGAKNPTSYQPAYRVNIYPKGLMPITLEVET